MDSPFRPGSAAQPPVLAGREELLRGVVTSTASAGNRRSSFQVLYGPRGVGKTVVLDRFAGIAEDRRWAVVRHDARAPDHPIEAVIEGLNRSEGLTKRLGRELAELRELGPTLRYVGLSSIAGGDRDGGLRHLRSALRRAAPGTPHRAASWSTSPPCWSDLNPMLPTDTAARLTASPNRSECKR